MADRKRLHPERLIMVLALVAGITTYAFFGIGYFFEKPSLYRWGTYSLVTTLAIGVTPLLGYLLCLAIEKIRGNHDHD